MKIKQDSQINSILIFASLLITFIVSVVYFNFTKKLMIKENSFFFTDQQKSLFLGKLSDLQREKKFELTEEKSTNSYSVREVNGGNKILYRFKADACFFTWISFGDVNNDGIKDLINIYRRKDSIFVSVFDYKSKSIIYPEKFLLNKPKTKRETKWFLVINNVGVLKDKLNNTKLIFSLVATSVPFPRGIYSYDFASEELKTAQMSAFPFTTFSFDLNKDGIKEVIVSAISAPNKYLQEKTNKYPSTSSWLMVLNTEMEEIFSLQREQLYSQITVDSLSTNEGNFLVSIFMNHQQEGGNSEIFIVDSIGNVTKKRQLSNFRNHNLTSFNRDSIFVSYLDSVFIFDKNLQILNSNKINLDGGLSRFYKFTYEKENYYIHLNLEKFITVLDKNLSEVSTTTFSKTRLVGREPIVVAKNYENDLPEIILNTRNDYSIFQIIPNLLPANWLAYVLLIQISSLITLFLIKYLIKRVYTFIYYLSYSLGKSSNGIILLDEKLRIRFINSKAILFLCRNNTTSIKGKSVEFLYKSSQKFSQIITNFLSEDKVNSTQLVLNNGESIFKLILEFIPLSLSNGIKLGYYIRLTDLSEQIQVERAKVYSHSIQKITHEIKTPLSSILMNINALQIQLNQNSDLDKQETLEDLYFMEKEVERIRNLVNNLLKYADIRKPHFRAVNLESVIRKALKKFENFENKGFSFIVEVENDIEILVDEFQLIEAFHVFIENAIDAMNGIGEFKIVAQKQKEKGENIVRISLIDSGPGIPEEIQEIIFEPYVTTKKEGTGMGLQIAQKIIEDHGSKIEFTTDKNGTEFSFNFKII